MIGSDPDNLLQRLSHRKRPKTTRARLAGQRQRLAALDGGKRTSELRAPRNTRLRLVGVAEETNEPLPTRRSGEEPLAVDDPRWVLAVRAAQMLQGSIMPPPQRARLVQLGRVLGLSAFDSNLIIAIVQDQARRGHLPHSCPQAGAAQLGMVPLPRPVGWLDAFRGQRALTTALILATIIALELLLILALMP